MSGTPAITTAEQFFRSVEKRLASLERRPASGTSWDPVTQGWLQSSSNASEQGAASADFVYSAAQIVLQPGSWIVEGGAALINLVTLDTASVALWNVATGLVPNSRGPAGTTSSASVVASLRTRPTLMTVSAATTVRVLCSRNGASTIKAISAAAAPAAFLTARRIQ